MTPILEVENLSISFTQYDKGTRQHKLHVIRDLSLTIEPGQVVAVVGSSGSGKSLLAHGILGILPYNANLEGTLRFCGEPLTPVRAAQVRGREIVLVPQSVSYLDPLMKVGAQVRNGRRDRGSRDRCRDILGRYHLEPSVEELYPFELSGGMTRRILISTAVAESPRLVIADEPTPGLDARSVHHIMEHFREIADSGAGLLLITHDLEAALTIADRVAVFYAGETIEEAPSSDFAAEETLRHPYTRALWRAMPQHGFVPIAGTQPYPGTVPDGCPFAVRCPNRAAACEGEVPYRALAGGRVRCLHPERGAES